MGKRVRSISRALTLLTHHFRDAPDMTRAALFPNSPFLLIPRTGRFINTVVAAREHERNRGNRARSSPGISGDLHPSILSVHDVDLHRACGVDSVELTAGSTEYPSSFSPTFASLSLSQSEALLSLAGYTVVAPALSHPKSRNSLILSTVQGPFPTSAPLSLSLFHFSPVSFPPRRKGGNIIYLFARLFTRLFTLPLRCSASYP